MYNYIVELFEFFYEVANMRSNKKFLIELPLKVVLTEDGASNFISHNKKLMRFRLADNAEEYGIAFNIFSPQSLQNIFLLYYI